MFKECFKFIKDEDGAVTVDWVVLTAGMAFVGVLVVGGILQASTDQANGIGADIVRHGSDALK